MDNKNNTFWDIVNICNKRWDRSFMIDDNLWLWLMRVELLAVDNKNKECHILDRGELDENFEVYTYKLPLRDLMKARENYLENN